MDLILEEDLQLVRGQVKQIESSSISLKELWSPLKTSDLFVIEYRKWLDKNGSLLPYYQGYETAKLGKNNPQNEIIYSQEKERFYQHTQFCHDCNQTYQTTIRFQQILRVVAIALAALAIITDVSKIQIMAVILSLLSVGMAAITNQVKTSFERSYTRY